MIFNYQLVQWTIVDAHMQIRSQTNISPEKHYHDQTKLLKNFYEEQRNHLLHCEHRSNLLRSVHKWQIVHKTFFQVIFLSKMARCPQTLKYKVWKLPPNSETSAQIKCKISNAQALWATMKNGIFDGILCKKCNKWIGSSVNEIVFIGTFL